MKILSDINISTSTIFTSPVTTAPSVASINGKIIISQIDTGSILQNEIALPSGNYRFTLNLMTGKGIRLTKANTNWYVIEYDKTADNLGTTTSSWTSEITARILDVLVMGTTVIISVVYDTRMEV